MFMINYQLLLLFSSFIIIMNTPLQNKCSMMLWSLRTSVSVCIVTDLGKSPTLLKESVTFSVQTRLFVCCTEPPALHYFRTTDKLYMTFESYSQITLYLY